MIIDLELLYQQQLQQWPTAQSSYADLNLVEKRTFDFGEFQVKVHHLPGRIVSTAAKIDAAQLQARPCPLCEENRPKLQQVREWKDYSVALNPYPILPQHFTIMDQEHTPQGISFRCKDMIEFAMDHSNKLVLYNGPQSGASIPDHFHFQAIPKGYLPIEEDYHRVKKTEVFGDKAVKVYYFRNYLRDCFVLECEYLDDMEYWMEERIWQETGLAPFLLYGKEEPMMNLVFSLEIYAKENKFKFKTYLFPRRKHRPDQYFEEGDRKLLISPGTIDMAGILITPRKEDFDKITKEDIIDIYKQVSFKQ